jgi:hypothetical protein
MKRLDVVNDRVLAFLKKNLKNSFTFWSFFSRSTGSLWWKICFGTPLLRMP